MKPYYDHAGVTIYHGDCRDILPALPSCDLVLTDPPYGIASRWTGGWGRGWSRTRHEATERNQWDVLPDASTITACIDKGVFAVIWGGNYFTLPPSRGWLVWNKPPRHFSLAEAELAWTNRDMVIRVFDSPRVQRIPASTSNTETPGFDGPGVCHFSQKLKPFSTRSVEVERPCVQRRILD